MACFVIHPYVGFALWALALAVLLQEVFLLAALPFIGLWRWANRPAVKPSPPPPPRAR